MLSFLYVVGFVSERNSALIDIWSFIHIFNSAVLVLVLKKPWLALIITILWEPFEVLVLSPWLRQEHGVIFGHEGLANSLSDIIFNTIGVVCGVFILKFLMSGRHSLRKDRIKVKSS